MIDKEINKDENLIAHCGLYCGACPSFKSGKCDGCRGNSAKSAVVYKKCKVKPCCADNGFFTCADCTIYASTKACKKYNSFKAIYHAKVHSFLQPALPLFPKEMAGTCVGERLYIYRVNDRLLF